jgi:HlyD family secretion protein
MAMMKGKTTIFRDRAIEQANSPEQLDRLVRVTGPRLWLSLGAFGMLIASATAWSLMADLPTTLVGKGVLIYPNKVVAAQANTVGQILDLKVKPGDTVKKGQVIATIDQSELKQQLQLSEAKLKSLERQDQDASFIQSQREQYEQLTRTQQRQSLQQNIDTLRSTSPALQTTGIASLQRERDSLRQKLQTLQTSLPTYRLRWEKRQELFEKERIITQDVAIQAKTEYEGIQAQINEIEVQLKQLDAKEIETTTQASNSLDKIASLEAQLKTLDSEKVGKVENDFSAATNRQKEIQEIQRTIAQLTTQLQKSSEVISTYDGVFLEVVVKPGQRLEANSSLGSISVRTASDQLQSIVFLDQESGKKVEAALQKNQAQGKSKLPVKITPTTVKREEYGGIKGIVERISPVSVTQAGAASLVGHPDLLKGILSEQSSQVVVFTSLECKIPNPTGADCQQYQWAGSEGTGQQPTAGTTTTVKITIEERKPITYILPFLKNLIGIPT